MRLTDRVKQILSWYPSDSPGTKMNLARLLNNGTLAGTGKLVILPVDQGFEHGPARSFAPNPSGYDPDYHVQLAIESGCNAYAAPLGFLEAVAGNYAMEIPLILKLNNSDSMSKIEPASAVTGSVKDAVRLGCAAVGYTIYPGSGARNVLLQELREIIEEAKEHSLPTVVWAYVRGGPIAKENEQAVDLIAYAAQEAAQLGAHVIKVKPPKDQVALPEAKPVYEKYAIPTKTLADRVRHVVQSCFDGKRIIIFSGGEAKDTPAVLDEIRGIRDGGGFGSIMGRNSFQRPRDEAVKLLRDVMGIYQGK
ncbi:MAG TPA: class I fructose-bisphosphate aldolase [Myxococcaceae bacterium]